MPDRYRISGLKFYFLPIFLLFFLTGFAQSEEEDELEEDSIITSIIVDPDTDNAELVFDSITQVHSAIEAGRLPDSVYNNLRKDPDYWYVNLPPPRKIKAPEEKKEYKKTWMESKAVRNFVLVLIIAIFLAAVIWFLSSSNIKLFEPKKKILEDENGEITEEDLFSINYENEIRTAVLAGNYRLATRLWYLRTLKELTERNLIRYKHEKTNTEYLDEIYETKYYKGFSRLTRNFEYAWYGKFDLTEDAYKMVEKEFADFNRLMN